ncbi:MAG TPA: hypothetical protein VIV61_06630 [Candidatus Ozemobacteraceae bacterium]
MTACVAAFYAGVTANLAQVAILRMILGEYYGTELHLGSFLGLWLAGIAIGGAVAGVVRPSPLTVLTSLAVSPAVGVLLFLAGNLLLLPAITGSFLPILPVLAVTACVVLPVALPVGALLPALAQSGRTPFGCLFAAESTGGAVGGLVFSGLAGGAADTAQLLIACIVLSLTGACLAATGRKRRAMLLALAAIPIAAFGAGHIDRAIDDLLWNHTHVGYRLVDSFDTPYQSVSVAAYGGEYALYLDRNLTSSWPDRPGAELRVHSFLSALPDEAVMNGRMAILGIPSPDILHEALKYPGLGIDIIDLDATLMNYMKKYIASNSRVAMVIDDPRRFLRAHPSAYDAILVLPADPTTLAGNRLFTAEAVAEGLAALTPHGAIDYSVAGAENYLSGPLAATVRTLYRNIASAAADIHPIPGDPIHFRAARQKGLLADTPDRLAERFRSRNIPTTSFRAELFADLLLPFRVAELRSWLASDEGLETNTDLHPAALVRQLELWDVYSDSGISGWLKTAARIRPRHLPAAVFVLFLGIALVHRIVACRTGQIATAAVAVGATGFFGLAAEMMLLLQYQGRNGAMFGMAAVFFGLYMLGLGIGGILAERLPRTWMSITAIKAAQLLIALVNLALVRRPEYHTAVVLGGSTLVISCIAGLEFPLAVALSGGTPRAVAWLVAADNLPAMMAACMTGILLLPGIGYEGTWMLLAALTGLAALFPALSQVKCPRIPEPRIS